MCLLETSRTDHLGGPHTRQRQLHIRTADNLQEHAYRQILTLHDCDITYIGGSC